MEENIKIVCVKCEKKTKKAESKELNDKLYCQSCFDDIAIFCGDCEDAFDNRQDSLHSVCGDNEVCDSCYDDYATCNRCDIVERTLRYELLR